MQKSNRWIASLAFALTTLLVASSALAQSGHRLLGGPHGIVKSTKGDLLEGMMVQLVSHSNAVRTTVYSNADGRYEFPKLDNGTYTLRIAQPREFAPYVRDAIEVDGATRFDDIALTRIAKSELLPPTPEIATHSPGRVSVSLIAL